MWKTYRWNSVSIPHRFNSHWWSILKKLNQNSFNPSQVQFTRFMLNGSPSKQLIFQSLTGSIHTSLNLPPPTQNWIVSIPHRFNSHSKLPDCQIAFLEFQSLTGSIHTKGLKIVWVISSKVSIPHRFNSHRSITFAERKHARRFNPSQVQFTHKTRTCSSSGNSSFNPSQVQFTLS